MPAEDYAPKIVARFWLKVRRDGGVNACWEWTASKRGGYGQFGVRQGLIVPAHRYAYEYLVGPIPDGLTLDHLCRNRACVNPKHLEPVSNVENVMRGESPRAVNARKQHCDHGHPFDAENTYTDKRGRRHCRACRARRTAEFNARNPDYRQRWWRENGRKRTA